ncbi:MAG TPA: hypothetical protein VH880_06255 [Anaeromyxobacteraceae bacterium]
MSLALWLAWAPVAGCGTAKSTCVEFAKAVGFEPLEAVGDEVAWPAPPPDLATRALNVFSYPTLSHAVAHGRGIVRAPLAKVYAAMKLPRTSRIHSPGDLWTPTLDVEPEFPVSFQIHYVVHNVVTVEWDLLYRAGPLEGTSDAPLVAGLRYQKTCGSEHIAEQSGSLVASPLPGDPTATRLELVGWLNASGQDYTVVAGTLEDMYGNLVASLTSMP